MLNKRPVTIAVCMAVFMMLSAVAAADDARLSRSGNERTGAEIEAAVELPEEDCQALAALIAGKPFRGAIDLHTGYTPAYSLEFYDADGVAARLLIQSFGNGRLRLDGTDWEYDFEGEDGEYLLSTLEKHHSGDSVLEAA